MFRAILALVIVYLIWSLIKPLIARIDRQQRKKTEDSERQLPFDKNDIQDAEYRDIDDSEKNKP